MRKSCGLHQLPFVYLDPCFTSSLWVAPLALIAAMRKKQVKKAALFIKRAVNCLKPDR